MKKILFYTLFCFFAGTINGAASNEKTLFDSPNLKIVDYSPETVRQEGVDCGLHSTKNALALYRHFSGQTTKDTLVNQLKQESVGPYPHMPACRVATTGSSTSKLLDGDQVELFAKKVGFPLEQLTVLENIDIPHFRQSEKSKLAQLVYKLKNKQSAVHAFVIGNMQERTGTRKDKEGKEITTTTGKTGHYIGAALHYVPGAPITIYIADSGGEKPAPNTAIIQKLMHLLNRINPTKLQFEEVDHHFKDAQRYMAEDATTTLQHIEQLIASVQTYNLFNDHFVRNYQKGTQFILNHIEPYITDTEKDRWLQAQNALASQEGLMRYHLPARADSSSAASSSSTASSTPTATTPDAIDDDLAAALAASRQSMREEQAAIKARLAREQQLRTADALRARQQAASRTTPRAAPAAASSSSAVKTLSVREIKDLFAKATRGEKISAEDIRALRANSSTRAKNTLKVIAQKAKK